jgi:hypothetical protein
MIHLSQANISKRYTFYEEVIKSPHEAGRGWAKKEPLEGGFMKYQ